MVGTPCVSLQAAEAIPAMRYRVSFPQAANHYAQVELEFTPREPGVVKLILPVWTPGSYLIREYARHIDSVIARDSKGELLDVHKSAKNIWETSVEAAGPLTIRYRVYCNELSVRSNFIDSSFGVLNGAAFFLTTEECIDQTHRVELQLPGTWGQSVSSLSRPIGMPNTYLADNYDQLVDSPIVMGNPTIHPFQVGDAEHYLVSLGGDGLWDFSRAAADTARIVAEHQAMWEIVPYEKYYFFNLVAEGSGGLEHDNSTLLLTSRWSFGTSKNYHRWLGLVSHEFFHAWNIRRLRPQALMNYDYNEEVYFEELWVAEGITSYYDDLGLVRCGLIKPKEYLELLSGQIETLQETPGRLRQSLAESSFDTWIRFYRPDENSSNATISYYNKGAVTAFLLDMQIRRATRNNKSLDDVMRTLYKKFVDSPNGYTNVDVQKVAEEIAGTDLSKFFQTALYSTEELDYSGALEWLGIQFAEAPTVVSLDPAKPGASSGIDPGNSAGSNSSSNTHKSPWLGVTTESPAGRLTIVRIIDDSPAYAAGLNVGDELIAFNDLRVDDKWEEKLKQLSHDSALKVHVARRGKLLELDVQLAPKPMAIWKLRSGDKPTNFQQTNFNNWLHLPEKQ
jgi:predicted metalloprotease with PDZ domain